MHMLPDTGWTGESSGLRMPDGSVHSLGAIEHCPPNGCWTDNHTKSSCNNATLWVPQRNQAPWHTQRLGETFSAWSGLRRCWLQTGLD